MVDIVYSEDFSQKYASLGETSRNYFDLRLNLIWLGILDIHSTKIEDELMIEETILGSDKKIKVNYSRSRGSIAVDITD